MQGIWLNPTTSVELLTCTQGRLCMHNRPFFPKEISTCHSRKSAGVNNNLNDGWIPFGCSGFRPVSGSLSLPGKKIDEWQKYGKLLNQNYEIYNIVYIIYNNHLYHTFVIILTYFLILFYHSFFFLFLAEKGFHISLFCRPICNTAMMLNTMQILYYT